MEKGNNQTVINTSFLKDKHSFGSSLFISLQLVLSFGKALICP